MIDTRILLTFVTGLAARLLIPVIITAVAVYMLRRLDARWQSEGRNAPAKAKKPACWETMDCPPEGRKTCAGYKSPLPCWQARRTENGYLREECLGCKVFAKAPVPGLG
jgi:hypothetical protein